MNLAILFIVLGVGGALATVAWAMFPTKKGRK